MQRDFCPFKSRYPWIPGIFGPGKLGLQISGIWGFISVNEHLKKFTSNYPPSADFSIFTGGNLWNDKYSWGNPRIPSPHSTPDPYSTRRDRSSGILSGLGRDCENVLQKTMARGTVSPCCIKAARAIKTVKLFDVMESYSSEQELLRWICNTKKKVIM